MFDVWRCDECNRLFSADPEDDVMVVVYEQGVERTLVADDVRGLLRDRRSMVLCKRCRNGAIQNKWEETIYG